MSKKKEPDIKDAVELFESVMVRSSLSDYYHVNSILLSKNPKDQSVLIIPDATLWNAVLKNEELCKHIKELDITDPYQDSIKHLFAYGEEKEGWIDLDLENLYKGDILKIKVDNFEYDLSINKNLLPLKLRKSEFNNISYRIFNQPRMVLGLRKRFDFPIENCGFSMMRVWQIT